MTHQFFPNPLQSSTLYSEGVESFFSLSYPSWFIEEVFDCTILSVTVMIKDETKHLRLICILQLARGILTLFWNFRSFFGRNWRIFWKLKSRKKIIFLFFDSQKLFCRLVAEFFENWKVVAGRPVVAELCLFFSFKTSKLRRKISFLIDLIIVFSLLEVTSER